MFGLCLFITSLSDPSGLTGWPTSRTCTAFLGNIGKPFANPEPLHLTVNSWQTQGCGQYNHLMWSMGFPPTSTPSKDPGKLLSRSKFGPKKIQATPRGLSPTTQHPTGMNALPQFSSRHTVLLIAHTIPYSHVWHHR